MATSITDAYGGAFLDRGGSHYNLRHPDFGAVGDGNTDDTPALGAAKSAGANMVIVPEGSYVLSPAELTDLGIEGRGQATNLISSTSSSDTLIKFLRGGSGRYRHARDFQVSVDSDLHTGILISYPRFLLENVRLSAASDVAVSNALIQIEDAWIVTLLGIICLSQEEGVVGLRLGTSANAIDVIGGEFATRGDGIVIDAGSRIRLQTTIEGTAESAVGLVINGGSAIHVESYFESSGIEINGGERITIGGSRFSTAQSVITINGGESIVFDGPTWLTSAPRNPVNIASGLDHEVSFRQATSFGAGRETKHVLSGSIVNGDNVGPNLFTDPYFTEWTGDTPDNFTISNSGGSVAVTHETTDFLTGTGALRCEINEATTSARGIDIDLSGVLDDLKGHWATVSAWLYLPNIEGSGNSYRVRLRSSPTATDEQEYSVAQFAAVNDTWAFFSHSLFVDPSSTDLDVEIRVLGTKVGTEYFIIDRIALTRGKTSQNIPILI